MATTKKQAAPKMKRTEVDALIKIAAEAWSSAEGQKESAQVMAVRPLVVSKIDNSDTRKRFAAAVGQKSTSTVGRYFQAAALTVKHGMTVPESKTHGGTIVRALKVKGGPDALKKVADKATLIEAASGIAARGTSQKRAARQAGNRKSEKVAEKSTVAQLAGILSGRLDKAASGGEALTNRDMEALALLAGKIAALSSVTPVAPTVRQPSRRKVA